MSIRRQLLLGMVLGQSLLLAGFVVVLARWQVNNQNVRARARIVQQSDLLAQSVALALDEKDVDAMDRMVAIERHSTTITSAQIVDLQGRAIAHTDPLEIGKESLGPFAEGVLQPPVQRRLVGTKRSLVASTPIVVKGKILGIAVIEPDWTPERTQVINLIRWSVGYGLLALLANAIAAFLLARLVSRPVHTLLGLTEQVSQGAEMGQFFPMRPQGAREVNQLIVAFNSMTDTLEKRNTGLSETLSLLDSMLTNAPVGFAFFDRRCRFVRLNAAMADVNGGSVVHHLGRPAREMLPVDFGRVTESRVAHVFDTGETLRDVELNESAEGEAGPRTWLANFFPVRAADAQVRWAGMIVTEISERRRTEEMLRRTEKLAAAGRLAASIAHEINNPLEGITNLLYLLRQDGSMMADSRKYVEMAQHEVARVSEITQQTLRFHRQSTGPVRVHVPELFESVLVLYSGRVNACQIHVEKRYREPAELNALAGELRQVLANLVGNAIDATAIGGRLILRVTPSRHWVTGNAGLRVTVADTGSGMDEATRRHIFEPFFTTKEATGTGLGLWVSAEILEKHHATMGLRSRKPEGEASGGTVFYIFFPLDGISERVRGMRKESKLASSRGSSS